jgi:hypothetical protein
MAWAGKEVCLGIVVRSLVLVLNAKTDGCTESDSKLCTALNADGVRLISLRFALVFVRFRL